MNPGIRMSVSILGRSLQLDGEIRAVGPGFRRSA
jgi:hypothetical protein